jgi:hypothetical protein
MTDAPISRLRRRMIEDMTVRKLTPRTQQGYNDLIQVGGLDYGETGERRLQLAKLPSATSVSTRVPRPHFSRPRPSMRRESG